MAWRAKIKNIVDNASQYDTIQIEIEYYNLLGREAFTEIHPFTLENDFENIRIAVLKKLATINQFRSVVDGLKLLIGKVIEDSTRAVSLGLTADPEILK